MHSTWRSALWMWNGAVHYGCGMAQCIMDVEWRSALWMGNGWGMTQCPFGAYRFYNNYYYLLSRQPSAIGIADCLLLERQGGQAGSVYHTCAAKGGQQLYQVKAVMPHTYGMVVAT